MTAALDHLGRTLVHREDIDDSSPPQKNRDRSRDTQSRVLFATTLVLAWFITYYVFLSGFEQNHDQKQLYGELRTALAKGTAPTGAAVASGVPVGLLNVPGTSMRDLVVVEDVGNEQLQSGPGHLRGSVLPGQEGVSVVLGRSMSFGGPFAHIADLKRGQSIQVTTGLGTARYAVTGVRRIGDRVPPALKAKEGRLTLVTAAGAGRLAALQPSSTVYVDARLTSKVLAGGTSEPLDPKASIMSGRWDTATLAQIALALQFLALSLAATIWGWRRWSRVGAWVAGVPVVTAALWLTSSLVSRLLPGLI